MPHPAVGREPAQGVDHGEGRGVVAHLDASADARTGLGEELHAHIGRVGGAGPCTGHAVAVGAGRGHPHHEDAAHRILLGQRAHPGAHGIGVATQDTEEVERGARHAAQLHHPSDPRIGALVDEDRYGGLVAQAGGRVRKNVGIGALLVHRRVELAGVCGIVGVCPVPTELGATTQQVEEVEGRRVRAYRHRGVVARIDRRLHVHCQLALPEAAGRGTQQAVGVCARAVLPRHEGGPHQIAVVVPLPTGIRRAAQRGGHVEGGPIGAHRGGTAQTRVRGERLVDHQPCGRVGTGPIAGDDVVEGVRRVHGRVVHVRHQRATNAAPAPLPTGIGLATQEGEHVEGGTVGAHGHRTGHARIGVIHHAHRHQGRIRGAGQGAGEAVAEVVAARCHLHRVEILAAQGVGAAEVDPHTTGLRSTAQAVEEVHLRVVPAHREHTVVTGIETRHGGDRDRGHIITAHADARHGVLEVVGARGQTQRAEDAAAQLTGGLHLGPSAVQIRRTAQHLEQVQLLLHRADGDLGALSRIGGQVHHSGHRGGIVHTGRFARHDVVVCTRGIGGGVEEATRYWSGPLPHPARCRGAAQEAEQVHRRIGGAPFQGGIRTGTALFAHIHHHHGRCVVAGGLTHHGVGVATCGVRARQERAVVRLQQRIAPGATRIGGAAQHTEQIEGRVSAAYGDAGIAAGHRGDVHRHGHEGGVVGAGESAGHHVHVLTRRGGSGGEQGRHRIVHLVPAAVAIGVAAEHADQRERTVRTAHHGAAISAGPRGDYAHHLHGGREIGTGECAGNGIGIGTTRLEARQVRARVRQAVRTRPSTPPIGITAQQVEEVHRLVVAAHGDAAVGAGVGSGHFGHGHGAFQGKAGPDAGHHVSIDPRRVDARQIGGAMRHVVRIEPASVAIGVATQLAKEVHRPIVAAHRDTAIGTRVGRGHHHGSDNSRGVGAGRGAHDRVQVGAREIRARQEGAIVHARRPRPCAPHVRGAAQRTEKVHRVIVGAEGDGVVEARHRRGGHRHGDSGHRRGAGRGAQYRVGVYARRAHPRLEDPGVGQPPEGPAATRPRRAIEHGEKREAGIAAAHQCVTRQARIRRGAHRDGQRGAHGRARCISLHGIDIRSRVIRGRIEHAAVRPVGPGPLTAGLGCAPQLVEHGEGDIIPAGGEAGIASRLGGGHHVHRHRGLGRGTRRGAGHRVGVRAGRGAGRVEGAAHGQATGACPHPARLWRTTQQVEQVERHVSGTDIDGRILTGIGRRAHAHGHRRLGIGTGRRAGHGIHVGAGLVHTRHEDAIVGHVPRTHPSASRRGGAPQDVDEREGGIIGTDGHRTVGPGVGCQHTGHVHPCGIIGATRGAHHIGIVAAGLGGGVVAAGVRIAKGVVPSPAAVGRAAQQGEQVHHTAVRAGEQVAILPRIGAGKDLGRPPRRRGSGIAHEVEGEAALGQ